MPGLRCPVGVPVPEEEVVEPLSEMEVVAQVHPDKEEDAQEEDEGQAADHAHLEAAVRPGFEPLARLADVRPDRHRRHGDENDEDDAHRPAHIAGRDRRVRRVAEARAARERHHGEQDEQREEDARDAEATSVTLGERLHASAT